jgi:Domain of unknown function (DUF4266)
MGIRKDAWQPMPAMLLLLLLTGGCTPVAPWQRGNLAKPHMALEPDPATAAVRRHIHVSKEASSGGYGSGGGGCGCN